MMVVHPLFHPLPGLTHFLCLAKESKQRKARPRWRLPLEFMSPGGEGKNSLRSDSFPSFFRPLTEIQGAIKGRNVNGQTVWRLVLTFFSSLLSCCLTRAC
ncbi:hypothetical protein ACN9M1_25050 [Ralstonia sp. R-29]|uniref:hypothetical protein n=1 Tax=Ralstonia sp. R-29 TaxID=3404059 RepID=UPI003CFA4A46